MNSTNTINPKPCNYNCGTSIYWNTLENAYYEVLSGNKHQCPNRQHKSSNYNKKAIPSYSSSRTTTNKPGYYSNTNTKKSSWSTTHNKPKMSNSLELLQGSIENIQKQYEILSDIVRDSAGGKVHGSQSHISPTNNSISLIVYFEVQEGKREEIKQRFLLNIDNK
jgi:hypothetical protein